MELTVVDGGLPRLKITEVIGTLNPSSEGYVSSLPVQNMLYEPSEIWMVRQHLASTGTFYLNNQMYGFAWVYVCFVSVMIMPGRRLFMAIIFMNQG